MKALYLLTLGIALSSLVACGDYAYGPNAPESEQIKHWGGVGKNQPVAVGPSRKTLLKLAISDVFIQPGHDKYQTIDDYMNCTAQANHPNANQALSTSYKRAICMFDRGYDFATITTTEKIRGKNYASYCGHELFRAKNLAFCRSTSNYQAKLDKHLATQDTPEPYVQLWSSQSHSYRQKVIDALDCDEIAGGTATHWSYYPFHQTLGKCMTKRGYEFVDNVEGYKKYAAFCGWKPYFLNHTEFCLTNNQDSIYYERNMSLFKDYYELHGLPNPNDTTRPGDTM